MGNYPFMSPLVLNRATTPPRADDEVTFATISTEDSFVGLGETWDALVRSMPRPSPFLLHGWLTEWWRHYGDGCSLAVQAAFRGRKLIGALPLIVFPRHGLKVSTFLGARQSVPADILLAEGENPAVAATLVARAATSGQDYAELFGLPGDCRLAAFLGPSRLHLFQRIEAPVLDLSEGWEATYRARTTAKKRGHHRRRRRQLEALGDVVISVSKTPADLKHALEDAFRLHSLRWDGRPDGSGFTTPTGMRFNRAVLNALAEIDVPRIVTLQLDGRAIAFVYYFALAKRLFLHRTAFDPAFARFSPGLVTTLAALETAAGESLTRVEFLGGADRYKIELTDRFEPLHLGLGLAGSAVGQVALAARTRWLRLREVVKRSEGAQRVYYSIVPRARLHMARPRDVLRPTGVRKVER